jgi:transglutaminase-like putative cysteine protease
MTEPRQTTSGETLAIAVAAGTTVAAALVALAARGMLNGLVAALMLLLVPAAAAAPVVWPWGVPARRRMRIAQPVVVGCFVLAGVKLLDASRAGGEDPALLVDGIGRVLAPVVGVVLLAQLAAAVTFRHLGVVMVASGVAFFMAVGTSPEKQSPDVTSVLGLALLVGWSAAVVTLWLLHRAREALRAPHRIGGDRRVGVGLPALLVAGSVLVALLALLLPRPEGVRPPTPGTSAASDGSTGTSMDAGAAAPRSPQSYLEPGMDLNARGSLPTTELVEVPAGSPQLWRAASLWTYDGRRWGPGPWPVEPFRLRTDAGGDYDLDVLGGRSGRADAERSDLVRPLVESLPLLAPGRPVAVRTAAVVSLWPGSIFRGTAAGVGSSGAAPYAMTSTAALEEPVSPLDVALPPTVTERTRALAVRLTRGRPTVLDKVAAIERHLRATARYDLDSPVPDEGEDAVDDFLFESHEGFCEHFASAEAVLLRSVGVPARVVTGFAGGTPRGAVRMMTGADAHAWVQVHVGDSRWVWTDPTAGATSADDEPGLLAGLWALVRAHALLVAGLLVTATLGALAAVLLVRRARRRSAAARAAAAPLDVKVRAAMAALERVLSGTSLARAATESLEELRRRVVAGWPTADPPDPVRVADAFDVVHRVLYGTAPVGSEDALHAVAVLDDLTARLRGSRESLGAQHVWARGWRWTRSPRARRSATSTGTPRTSAAGHSSRASSTTPT